MYGHIIAQKGVDSVDLRGRMRRWSSACACLCFLIAVHMKEVRGAATCIAICWGVFCAIGMVFIRPIKSTWYIGSRRQLDRYRWFMSGLLAAAVGFCVSLTLDALFTASFGQRVPIVSCLVAVLVSCGVAVSAFDYRLGMRRLPALCALALCVMAIL